jgi:hypothetical protein
MDTPEEASRYVSYFVAVALKTPPLLGVPPTLALSVPLRHLLKVRREPLPKIYFIIKAIIFQI